MRKIKKVLSCAMICMLFVTTLAMAGCGTQLTKENAVIILQEAIKKSLEYDVYYWKQLVISGGNAESINVNVHADANTEGMVLDENGNYVNYAVRIEKRLNNTSIEEIYCGLSKSSKNEETQNYLIKKQFGKDPITGFNAHLSSEKQLMSPYDYVKSDEFKQHALTTKLFELSLLTLEDFDFSIKDAKAKTVGVITSITCKITDNFCDNFLKKYAKESNFRGEKVEIEIAYNRVSKIVVYQEKVLDSHFTSYDESYKFELVYLGKNIWVPSYDDTAMKYVK